MQVTPLSTNPLVNPYFLMFAQEPHLPVDFLLGRVPEPADGRVEDWVWEYQQQLQVAYDGARANYRKGLHDAGVDISDLKEK